MAFATLDDLEDRLRVVLVGADAVAGQALLDAATTVIKSHARQNIEQVTDDTVTFDGNGGTILELPQIPVTSVASVTVEGELLTADDDYLISGAQGLLYRVASGVWNSRGLTWGVLPQSIVVVYTHGYAVVPDDLQAVCVEIAARAWSTPAGAVRQESIGSYSVTYDTRSLQAAGLSMTETEQATVERYGRLVFA